MEPQALVAEPPLSSTPPINPQSGKLPKQPPPDCLSVHSLFEDSRNPVEAYKGCFVFFSPPGFPRDKYPTFKLWCFNGCCYFRMHYGNRQTSGILGQFNTLETGSGTLGAINRRPLCETKQHPKSNTPMKTSGNNLPKYPEE